jgi:hypothetical protein
VEQKQHLNPRPQPGIAPRYCEECQFQTKPLGISKSDFDEHPAAMFLANTSTSSTDASIIVVLDNRILNKKYGQAFLDALPPCPVEII